MFWHIWKKTLVANTFAQKKFESNQENRKDIFIHAIHWSFKPTNWAEFDGADPDIFISFQIGNKSESDIVGLSSNTMYKYAEMFGNIGTGAPVENSNIKMTGYKEFKKSIRIPRSVATYLGVKSAGAGEFSVRMLVSENDV